MDIDKFKSQFSDILRQNRFIIEIFPPDAVRKEINLELVSCMAVSTSLPFGKIIQKEKLRYGKKYQIATNWDLDPINISFLVESKGKILDFFKKWKDLIVDDENLMSYLKDYAGTINIMMLDVQEQNIFEAKLINAFPASIEAIELTMDSGDFIKIQTSIVFSDVKYEYNGLSYPEVIYKEPKKREYATMDLADISTRNIITNIDAKMLTNFSKYVTDKINSKIDFSSLNKRVDIPIVGAIDINIGSFLEEKTKQITSNVGEVLKKNVDEKVKKAQESFNQKYVNKLNEKLNNLSSSMENKVSKIFSF